MTLEQTLPLLTDLVNLKELILIWLHLYIYVYTHGTKIKAYENFISNIYWKINFQSFLYVPVILGGEGKDNITLWHYNIIWLI